MLLLKLLKWLSSPLGTILSAAAAVTGLVTAFLVHDHNQQAIGASKAVTRQEKANANATSAAAAAARRSLDPDARGLLNPNYRAD